MKDAEMSEQVKPYTSQEAREWAQVAEDFDASPHSAEGRLAETLRAYATLLEERERMVDFVNNIASIEQTHREECHPYIANRCTVLDDLRLALSLRQFTDTKEGE
jgi:hypothetical protein